MLIPLPSHIHSTDTSLVVSARLYINQEVCREVLVWDLTRRRASFFDNGEHVVSGIREMLMLLTTELVMAGRSQILIFELMQW